MRNWKAQRAPAAAPPQFSAVHVGSSAIFSPEIFGFVTAA
jgi:hypothetical protein